MADARTTLVGRRLERETRRTRELADELLIAVSLLIERLGREHVDLIAENPLLDIQGAAEFLGVPASWIQEKITCGEIPSIKLGKYRRFHPKALRDWALAHQTGLKKRRGAAIAWSP